MRLNATYLRIAPNGDKTFIDIETVRELKHHESLEQEGFVYHLQSVSTPPTCESCSA